MRYVLRGSVQTAGDHLRVTAQLIDTATSVQLWAERYDRPMAQFFRIQDDILQRIVVALDVKLLEGEQSRMRSSKTSNLDAWLLYREGLRDFRRCRKPRNLRARRAFREALRLDPRFTSARVGLAWTYAMEGRNGWADDVREALEQAERLARQVLRQDAASGEAYMVLGSVYNSRRDYARTLTYYRRAAALAPNSAAVAGGLGVGLMVNGQFQAALAQFRRAFGLAPRPPNWITFQAAVNLYLLGFHEESIALMEPFDGSAAAHLLTVACLVEAARLEEAREAAAAANRRFGPGRWAEKQYMWGIPFREPRHLQRLRAALLRAGIEVSPAVVPRGSGAARASRG